MRAVLEKWIRFINDINYDLLVPPLGLDCSKLTPKQAKENFDWFVSKIPERMKYLSSRCASDLKLQIEKLDFSAESILLIWKWFLGKAQIERTPKDEIEQMKRKYAQFGDSWVEYERFSVATEYVIRDIGMYLGQAFVHFSNHIEWGYVTKPKNLVHVNAPILIGFEDYRYTPTFKPQFEPISAVRRQALNLMTKESKESDLYNLFIKWLEYVPKVE